MGRGGGKGDRREKREEGVEEEVKGGKEGKDAYLVPWAAPHSPGVVCGDQVLETLPWAY